VKRLSIAVLVNDKQAGPADKPQMQPRTPEELARIEKLVRSAVGVDESRGDVISVVGVPFVAAAPSVQNEPKPDLWSKVQEVQRPALSTLGLVLAFVVALLAIRSLRTPAKSQLAAPAPRADLPGERLNAVLEQRPVVPIESPMRQRVVATVEQQPDMAAKLVRAWMRE
jgi:flagellar M-ring protein FliF